MDHFNYQNDELFCEQVPLAQVAKTFGTPCYVYSLATLKHHYQVFTDAFEQTLHLICYAVKANSNLAVLNLLAKLGSGFDIVSLGELQRVIKAGGSPNKVVFSGVGKQDHELLAALKANIFCFNIESSDELGRLNQIAEHENLQANIAIRINPDVDPKSHPFISTGLKENKFGIPMNEAKDLYTHAKSLAHIQINGVASHIGSQILELSPFVEMASKLNDFILSLQAQGIYINHVDLGGGLGVPYTDESPPSPKAWVQAIRSKIQNPNLKLLIEPGRALAANAGVLLTKVVSLKKTSHKNFAIVDAAMNDLLRPALYSAEQDIIPVQKRHDTPLIFDVVGPICETGDYLGKERKLSIEQDDLICVRGAGAYGFVMSSNYNSRPRAAEVMIADDKQICVRARETFDDLISGESVLPDDMTGQLKASSA